MDGLPLHEGGAVLQDLLVLPTLLHKAVPVLLDGGEVLLDLAGAGLWEVEEQLLPFLTDLRETHLSLLHTLHRSLDKNRDIPLKQNPLCSVSLHYIYI